MQKIIPWLIVIAFGSTLLEPNYPSAIVLISTLAAFFVDQYFHIPSKYNERLNKIEREFREYKLKTGLKF